MAIGKFRKVVVGPKVDLDTCGTVFFRLTGGKLPSAQALREMIPPVEIARSGRASEVDLADPNVLCVECGGSGRVVAECFDHHEAGGPANSATSQAYFAGDVMFEGGALSQLVKYINHLDTEGLKALGPKPKGTASLSDLFSGMLLTERDQAEQVRKGVVLLRDWLVQGPADPEGLLLVGELTGEWARWAEAKAENKRLLAETLEQASWGETKSGLRLAWLESKFFGASGALYGRGAKVVVLFNRAFGNPPVRKFTVAGDGVVVTPALERLSVIEPGWGGAATGTIGGSPPGKSSELTLEQVVEVVGEAL
ncbi:hypothetical protein HYW67_03220 [Candidatus Parcubacteria bacterium]|nr:hypothetical protein [Candidatus Parcubacteria bacterium]